jgi:hypothetical protein
MNNWLTNGEISDSVRRTLGAISGSNAGEEV